MAVSFKDAVSQYQKTYDIALEMEAVWEEFSIDELQRLRGQLEREIDSLLALSGLEWWRFDYLSRHVGFIKHYLDRGMKDACRADIRDIIRNDLPAGLRYLVTSHDDNSHLDSRLKEKILPLIAAGHNAAAVRCVFPVLSDRMKRIFNIANEGDGEALINIIFGNASAITALDSSDKTAMRNLLAGFYAVFRNKYAHNDIDPSLVEVKAIVELANSLLFQLQAVPLGQVGPSVAPSVTQA